MDMRRRAEDDLQAARITFWALVAIGLGICICTFVSYAAFASLMDGLMGW